MGSDRKHHKSHKKKQKHSKKELSKKKRRRDDSSGSDDNSYQERKRHKKERKKEKKRKDRDRKKDDSEAEIDPRLERNYALADALTSLLGQHPALASELPIMLVRMGGGTSFNLSHMTDLSAAQGLQQVFEALRSLGVDDASGEWTWTGPKNDLVLVRVVRAMLDEIGITMASIHEFETVKTAPVVKEPQQILPNAAPDYSDATASIQQQTKRLLDDFQNDALGKELAGLCQMILDGEVIALDSLPDEKLRTSLESLFSSAGLDKEEMEPDESDDDDDKGSSGPTMGFVLPEADDTVARAKLSAVLNVCNGKPAELPVPRVQRPIKGPALPVQQQDESSDDEEGPLPAGARVKGPSLPPEQIKAMADQRARMLQRAQAGEDTSFMPDDDNAREEWMLTPGKFDFLGSVKTGKSRTFEGKTKRQVEGPAKPVDPRIQSEINAIMQAHETSRGPSLLEQHRQQKAEQEASAGDKGWKWSRDKDLDAGRRVDKNALSQVLGGAEKGLKEKFAGGLGR